MVEVMVDMLSRFWLRRFAMVFLIAAPLLAAFEVMKQGVRGMALDSVVGWSAIAALVASSIATYWAYKRACRIPD